MNRGYIRLWRKFAEHEFWREKRIYSRAEAWIDIMAFLARGTANAEMDRGQFLGSVRHLAQKWRWSKSAVHRFLEDLEARGMIRSLGHQMGQQLGHFSVCEYSTYNEPWDSDWDSDWDTNKSPESSPEKEKKKAPPKKGEPQKKRKPPSSPALDPRYKPLSNFMVDEYKRVTGMELLPVCKPGDGGLLRHPLSKAPPETYSLEKLKAAWTAFLESSDKFHRKMRGQSPVRWWAGNLNAFKESEDGTSGNGDSGYPTYTPKDRNPDGSLRDSV